MTEAPRLTRSPGDRVIAGVCGGIAARYGYDPSVVRIVFVLIALLTAILPFVLTYLVAWWLVPVAPGEATHAARRVLVRSTTDRKLGGVIGGFAEGHRWDPTPLRILYVFATLVTLVVPGLVAYLVAWAVIPRATAAVGERPGAPVGA
jgi:phage shock protein PspC (stress-responsive transcriptional regulator)